jgi:hypothetical protein
MPAGPSTKQGRKAEGRRRKAAACDGGEVIIGD